MSRATHGMSIIATSSSSIAYAVSWKGLVWETIASGINPGFTIGNWGLFLTGNDYSVNAEAAFDWVRFS